MNVKYLTLDGMQVRITEWGQKGKPVIVCLHGLGSTSYSFIELGECLCEQYYGIAIDLPGHGKTSPFAKEEDYHMHNMVRWIHQVISNITDERFYLLAHSYGADIALHFLCMYPTSILKTMLLDGGYYSKEENYAYHRSLSQPITSLQEECDYYQKDFDEYSFETMEEHINCEKRNYERWSPLLEMAARDLVKFQDGKYRWHASGSTAVSAIKAMYLHSPESIYGLLPKKSIYLLQSTLPKSMCCHRDRLAHSFQMSTDAIVKRIEMAGHLIHWDQPENVANEIMACFC